MSRLCSIVVTLFLAARAAVAGEVTVAVASNFLLPAERIAAGFEAATGHEVTLLHGSTGQIYAQIVNGAPVDIFLAADALRPERLAEAGLAAEVRSYAIGRLVLVSRMPVDPASAAEAFAGRTVALADPTVAPYGLAATASMESLGLDTAAFRPVLVSNVGQVATMFATGNSDFAFVSAAQIAQLGAPEALAMDGRHPPIRQDAAWLARAGDNAAAAAFWQHLFSTETGDLIEASGFSLP